MIEKQFDLTLKNQSSKKEDILIEEFYTLLVNGTIQIFDEYCKMKLGQPKELVLVGKLEASMKHLERTVTLSGIT